MVKNVDIQYVGIEDVHELVEDVAVLNTECGHYASVELNDICGNLHVSVYIMLGGFDEDKRYDYSYLFGFGDDPYDIKQMNECKSTINNLLTEEEV